MADREARFAGEDQVSFQHLKKQREDERAQLIRDGIIDDPDKPVTLEHAKVLVGTCMDMCPRFEREERQFQNAVDKVEKDPITGRIDPRLAVKAYHRPAAGVPNPMPSDVRPPKVLVQTLDYLFHTLLSKYSFADVHPFIRDRTRSVRADFRVQNSDGPECIQSHERIIRFHILAIHLLTAESGFSTQQEMQQLRASMAALMDMYRSSRQRGIVPEHEAEFVAYRAFAFPDEPQEYMWLDDRTPSIVKTSSRMLGMTRTGDAKIFTIISQRKIPYLLACLMEPLFWDLRQRQLVGLNNKTFSRKAKFLTLEYVAQVLCLNSAEEARGFIEHYGLEVVEDPNGNSYITPKLRIDTSRPRQTLTIESSNLVESLRPPTSLAQIIDSGINAGGPGPGRSIPPKTSAFNPVAKPFVPSAFSAQPVRQQPSFPQNIPKPPPTGPSAFGKPVAAPGFGAPTPTFAPPTGPKADRPVFGKPVGQPVSNAFAPTQPGGPPRPAFGQPTPAFGKPTPAFGKPTNSLASAGSLDDEPPRPAFGKPTAPAFPSAFPSAAPGSASSIPTPAFGKPSAPAFGVPSAATQPPPPPPLPPKQPTQAPPFGAPTFPKPGPAPSVFDQPQSKPSQPSLFPSFPQKAPPSIPPPSFPPVPSAAPKPPPSVFDKPAASVFDQPPPDFTKPPSFPGFPSFPPTSTAAPSVLEQPDLAKRIEFPAPSIAAPPAPPSTALTPYKETTPPPPERTPTPEPIIEEPIRDIHYEYEDLPQVVEVYYTRATSTTTTLPPDLLHRITDAAFAIRPDEDITHRETAIATADEVADHLEKRLLVRHIFAHMKTRLLERQRRERLAPKRISKTKRYWRDSRDDIPARPSSPLPSTIPDLIPNLSILDIPPASTSSSEATNPRKRKADSADSSQYDYAHSSSQSRTPEPSASRSSLFSVSRSSVLGLGGPKRVQNGGVKSKEWRAMRYGVMVGAGESERREEKRSSLTASLMERIIKGKA